MICHTGSRQLGESFIRGSNQAPEIGISRHPETCPRSGPDLVPTNAIDPAIINAVTKVLKSPGSPIAYYQQVGRAGRALEASMGALLAGREDADIQDWFIRTAFPSREQAEQVVGLLKEAAQPMTLQAIEAAVNVRHTRLELMLKILEVEGAVERANGGWLRTLRPWTYDEKRVQRVTAARRAEQASMVAYASTAGCRPRNLKRYAWKSPVSC